MKKVLVLALLLVATPAMADWYVAGNFQGWDPGASQMNELVADAHYQLTFPGLTGEVEFKVTDGTWDNAWPGANAEMHLGTGTMDFTVDFFPGEHTDGWYPTHNRVGFTDSGLVSWELMGDFDGWSTGAAMTPMGGGMYTATITVPTAGDHYMKFREAGNWDLSNGFGGLDGTYGDAYYHTDVDNMVVEITMDIPNGRYQVVPEPATLAMLAFGAVALLRRR